MATIFSNIKERVLQIPDNKGLTKEKFFEIIGVTYGNFKGSAKEKALSSDTIANIVSIFPDISTEWLITGNGSMIKGTNDPVVVPIDPLSIGVPLIPIDAMAGFGTGSYVIMDYDIHDYYVVPDFKGADFMIRVKGSSMQPKYNSGDIVACRKLSIDSIFFQWNKVYVLDTAQGAIIKRLVKSSDQHFITCRSENKDYPDFDLNIKEDIIAIALIVGVIRFE